MHGLMTETDDRDKRTYVGPSVILFLDIKKYFQVEQSPSLRGTLATSLHGKYLFISVTKAHKLDLQQALCDWC